MAVLVALFGAAIAGLGILGFVRPRSLVGFVESTWQSRAGFYGAIGLRVVFGLLLLAAGPESRFPQVLWVVGMISLVAAVLSPLVGFERLRRYVQWWSDRSASLVRAWSLVTLGFGAFLVYAVW